MLDQAWHSSTLSLAQGHPAALRVWTQVLWLVGGSGGYLGSPGTPSHFTPTLNFQSPHLPGGSGTGGLCGVVSVPHLPPALHLICRRKWGDPEGKRGARTMEGKERDEEEQQEGRRQKKRRERNSLQAQRPGAQTLTSHSSDPEVQPGEARVACYPW